jgi:hypothetical protein
MLVPGGERDAEDIFRPQAALRDLDRQERGALLLPALPWPWLRRLVPLVPVAELSSDTGWRGGALRR